MGAPGRMTGVFNQMGMPTKQENGMNTVIRQLRKMALRSGSALTDGQLLECFYARQDEASFEELVRRHGPLVLGVCRRVLGNYHDAEDAFQATFLVLALKGPSLHAQELVGNWLYGVAYRTALRARAMTARRQKHEQRPRKLASIEPPTNDCWQELLPILDRELDGLPERYRVAVVLCDLEGITRREAAKRLGLPEGTLSGRLTRAHRLLARRLAKYGFAPSVGALPMILAENAVSAHVSSSLTASAAQAAVLVSQGLLMTGAVPAGLAALTNGVIKTMLLTKLKSFVAVAFVVLVSAGVIVYGASASGPRQTRTGDDVALRADDLEALRLEVEALRKGLQATQARVKTLEAELQSLRRTGGTASPKGANPGSATGESVPIYPSNVITPNGAKNETPRTPLADPFGPKTDQEHSGWFRDHRQVEPADDPITQAEAALKAVREARDAQSRQRAADSLEKALKRLKEQPKSASNNNYPLTK
jgi:RNA polymerase sigma factor (sigma-70 family)